MPDEPELLLETEPERPEDLDEPRDWTDDEEPLLDEPERGAILGDEEPREEPDLLPDIFPLVPDEDEG